MTGFLLINKPRGLTSFDCVRKIKKSIGDKKLKIGHAGTLDPFADGLLIIGIGRQATRIFGMDLDKKYHTKAKLGVLTDTLDKSGVTIKTVEKHVTQEELRNAIKELGKSYMQAPPIYSAVKYQGEPLYKLAREGKYSMDELLTIVQNKKKPVQLYDVQLIEYEFSLFTIDAHVSHGTYIRSLVNDIAQSSLCKSYATTFELRRTAIGPFNLENAVELDELKTADEVKKYLIPVDAFVKKVYEHQKEIIEK